jgi:hypothetical protein
MPRDGCLSSLPRREHSIVPRILFNQCTCILPPPCGNRRRERAQGTQLSPTDQCRARSVSRQNRVVILRPTSKPIRDHAWIVVDIPCDRDRHWHWHGILASPSPSPPGLAVAPWPHHCLLVSPSPPGIAIGIGIGIGIPIASCPRHRLLSSPSPPGLAIASWPRRRQWQWQCQCQR